ncbi:hypothetical protein [Octadecabacter sp. R77987]|uniref:hypothetical protein n=1 Tax=Octadecabacter sp. R77987 TaxID=3093874 RepID=UPI00366C8960
MLAADGSEAAISTPDTDDVAEDADEQAQPAPALRHTPPSHPDADSVAAKLQRIRAVVGSGNSDGETADYAEDLHAPNVADVDPIAAFDADDMEDAQATDMTGDLDDAVETADETPAGSDDDTLAAIIAQSGSDSDDDADTSDDVAPAEADGDDLVARFMDGDTDDQPAHESAEDDQPAADPAQDDQGDADTAEDHPDAADDAPIQPRVMRMKRAAFDAAVQAGALEEDVDDAADDGNDMADFDEDYDDEIEDDIAIAASLADLDGADDVDIADVDDDPLSAEEEAALMEELAEVERETGPQVAEQRGERRGRAILSETVDEDEAAMSRIMDQADAELAEPESNRRRQAISQLKAAVAATEAARALGEDKTDDGEAENAFREDLQQVVRPRRATRGEAQTERPRPAPLKLVASQRVDAPKPASDGPVTPVRPRRVATAVATAPSDADSFAEFAENMGATALPDLLEAAAAYTAFVEGAEEFSRPQIMKKVRALDPEEFNREDGLRSFGTLLREGRINKISNGRFQVSDQTRFHPERRSAAG